MALPALGSGSKKSEAKSKNYILKGSRLKTRDGFFVLFIWIFIRYFLYLIIDLQVISNEIQAV